MVRFSVIALIMAGCLTSVSSARAADYFTSLEIDKIRDAQSIGRRIPVFLEIAETRLTLLGLIEIEPEEERDDPRGNIFERALIRVIAPEASEAINEAADQLPDVDHDVTEFTRSDLLRGYYQAIEEAMDNIDDAYEFSRGDVRDSLEALKAFTEETVPLLLAFATQNEDEEITLEDAIEIAELARDGAEEALDIVPQTER
jgi:hypothetical protein